MVRIDKLGSKRASDQLFLIGLKKLSSPRYTIHKRRVIKREIPVKSFKNLKRQDAVLRIVYKPSSPV